MEDPAGRHTVAGALLDERSTPSLRERFGELAARSKSLAVAIRRVRLPGVDLSADELRQVSRVRVLLGQLDAGTFVAEADAVMVDPPPERGGRPTPLAPPDGDRGRPNRPAGHLGSGLLGLLRRLTGPTHAIYGCHWFQRPPPSPGPAFALVCQGNGASLGSQRFEELWRAGHDATPAVEGDVVGCAAAGGHGRQRCRSPWLKRLTRLRPGFILIRSAPFPRSSVG